MRVTLIIVDGLAATLSAFPAFGDGAREGTAEAGLLRFSAPAAANFGGVVSVSGFTGGGGGGIEELADVRDACGGGEVAAAQRRPATAECSHSIGATSSLKGKGGRSLHS